VITHQTHHQTQETGPHKYLYEYAKVIAQTITTINHQFSQAFSLMRGIQKCDKKGCQTAHKEMKQLHNCIIIKQILIKKLSNVERECAMESFIFSPKRKTI
jgi:hypothetical protein